MTTLTQPTPLVDPLSKTAHVTPKLSSDTPRMRMTLNQFGCQAGLHHSEACATPVTYAVYARESSMFKTVPRQPPCTTAARLPIKYTQSFMR